MTDETRRGFLGGVAAMPAFLSNPFRRRGSEKLTPLATEPDVEEAKLYNGIPSWSVKLDGQASSWDALSSWAGGLEDVEIRSEVRSLDLAFVLAPREQVGASVGLLSRTGGGLAAKEWVEWVDINVQLSIPDPARRGELLEDDGATQKDSVGLLTKAAMWGSSGSAPDSERGGLATGSDVSPRPVGDAHDTLESASQSQAAGGTVDTSVETVAVIDTGLNTDGNAIAKSRVLPTSANYVKSGNPTVEENGIGVLEDGEGHGTWVASSALANPDTLPSSVLGNTVADYRGPVPNADIWAAKALDDDGNGDTEWIAAAVGDAIDVGPDWICMSLGSSIYSKPIADAVRKAVDAGIGVVVASGNDRFGTTWIASPASTGEAMGIHATTAAPNDPTSVAPAWFANPGPHSGTTDLSGGKTAGEKPAVAAPGMDLEALVPTPTGATGTEILSGTSMAAPCVVGVAALVQAATGLADPMDVWRRLERTAYRPPALASVEGSGLPSAKRAIADTRTEQTQRESMNDTARARDAWYRSVSTAQGRRIPW